MAVNQKSVPTIPQIYRIQLFLSGAAPKALHGFGLQCFRGGVRHGSLPSPTELPQTTSMEHPVSSLKYGVQKVCLPPTASPKAPKLVPQFWPHVPLTAPATDCHLIWKTLQLNSKTTSKPKWLRLFLVGTALASKGKRKLPVLHECPTQDCNHKWGRTKSQPSLGGHMPNLGLIQFLQALGSF